MGLHAWQVADKPTALQQHNDALRSEALSQAPSQLQQHWHDAQHLQQQVLSATEDRDRLTARLADVEMALAGLRRTEQERTARCALSSIVVQLLQPGQVPTL